MAKVQQKFPKVFLACPFDKNMPFLIEVFEWLPWNVKPANKEVITEHLLVKITKDLKECDFAIFDITGWNANVCLELGLAKGLGKDFYILNNNTVKKEVPSDIKGIERIDYNWNNKKKAISLFEKLKDGLFKNKFLTSKIWKHLQYANRADEKFTLCLYILSRFKGIKKSITMTEIKGLAQGLHFKKQEDFTEVIQILITLKILKKTQRSGAFTLIKSLYR